MKRVLRRVFRIVFVISILCYSCRFVNPILIKFENDLPSESSGESWKGKLKNGKRIPNKGRNFKTVSYVFTSLGRNGVNHRVRDLMLEVYDTLYKLHPEWKYLYGETGWVKGGKFWPHYTHQNGLVVDFMVPVLNKKGKSTVVSSHIFNRWGYANEFDSTAKTKKYRIDFESMSTHLYFLKKLGPKHQLRIKRIIFAPEFLPFLYKASYGKYLKDIEFIYRPQWLRHDDHYHTEFEVID